jgi:hypothetical protein
MFDCCVSLFELCWSVPNPPSKLEPQREFIASERRHGTTYRRIAELLAEKGIDVDYSTIHAFVKVRSKPRRKVITMLEAPEAEATPATRNSGSMPKGPGANAARSISPERSGQNEAIRRLKDAKSDKPRPGKGLPSFQEDAPLERLSDEEARRLRKEL